MQAWQNYSMNNYPQYQQPMYQSIQSPYMDRLQQLQMQQIQPMQNSNQFPVIGKMVENMEMVKSTDIPMDGNMYYFPKADGSKIYTKRWLPNGTTESLTFKPVFDNEPTNSSKEETKSEIGLSSEVTALFVERFNQIFERIDKLENNLKATSSFKGEKEVANG